MKPRVVIVLALIVIGPLAIAAWLGVRLVRDEQAVIEHRFRELALGQLRAVGDDVARTLDEVRQTVLAEMAADPDDPETLRRRAMESTWVRQYFMVGADGRLSYPRLDAPQAWTESERTALERSRAVWEGGGLPGRLTEIGDTENAEAGNSGWHTWYWGSGLQLMLWSRREGTTMVAELRRARLLSEVVAALPDTDPLAPRLSEGRIRLVDSNGNPLYQWGAYEAAPEARPVAQLALGAPLGAWTVEFLAPPGALGGAAAGSVYFNLGAGLLMLAAVVVGLGWWLYREQSREMREAEQRVSFVNRVSHELKTPLTNIRMYAELLDRNLPDEGGSNRQHLSVIVGESQRLSRLIGNILTFGRGQRRALKLHESRGVVDDTVRSVLEHFAPSLQAAGVRGEIELAAAEPVRFDADALEQILGNLISNVEKYGASGGRLRVTTASSGETTTITVADDGPGLPARERDRVFRPFYRVDNSLTEGKGGAGIGLTIARELARLHGGDLQLLPSERGACFRLTLRCPPAAEENEP